ncbi:hypothetical protein GCM10007242_44830 [Pigmentiphaga litoralis]|uniref:hypothetical protein n=1 Tax=Pigmentiphaga litoralis TaxID=516702 RepID=UPI0016719361|nr:hypothetical protein [Pigmentiphaga litoralis]GGX32874.1 hypothetical protein GCM10007242_44830 [Pigmentiphaga litoralis]
MSPLSTLGIGVTIGLLAGAAAGWTAQGWRGTAKVQTQVALVATDRADAATAARTAEADQRQIEFNRMKANAQVTYNDQARRDANAQAARDNAAALVGLRNALAAAEFRAASGQAGGYPGARTGADDPSTLRTVADECTTAFEEMAGNAIGIGVTLTGLQDHVNALHMVP